MAGLTAGACGTDDTGPAPGSLSLPAVEATVGFGDGPLEGFLRIVPSGEETVWRYSVDLDADGRFDVVGRLSGIVAVPYRFTAVGPHVIRTVFEFGPREEVVDETVVVNDADAIQIEGSVFVDNPLEGIAVDRDGTTIYVGLSQDRSIAVLEAQTLQVQRIVDVGAEPGGSLEGLAVAPDESRLYVIDRARSLLGLELPALESTLLVESAFGRYFVVARPNRRVYTGGQSGVALIDTDSGTILRSFLLPSGIGHFALDPSGSRVALLENGPAAHAIHVLDASTLIVQRRVELPFPGPIPAATAFSSDGNRIYVLMDRDPYRLIVVDALSGEILRNMILTGDGCPECAFRTGVANPAARTADGRYVVFPTAIGAFFVDTTTDLPVFRTPDPESAGALFCCDVASSPTEPDVVFISDFDGRVFRLRIAP